MSTIAWILLFSFLAGTLSIIVVSVLLLVSDELRERFIPHLVSVAIGSLLGAAFLGLLPHAFESSHNIEPHSIFTAILLGLLGFFVLEKFVLWRHCHSHHCEVHMPDPEQTHKGEQSAAGTLILVGDSIHNFVDGILISAAFLTDIQLGVLTALAIAAHEIPQEAGDFIVLLHSGFSRQKALLFNILSSFATVIGAVAAYFSLSGMQQILPYVIAVAASSFIYVAVADLIPGLHKRTEFKHTLQQVILIVLGIVIILLAQELSH